VRPDNAEATSYFAAVACFCGGYAACAHKDATASEADEAERLAREKWNGRAAHPQPKGTVPPGYRLIPEEFMDWVGALPASKAEQRLAWLHSSESNNVDGYDWGVYRVKWEHGKPVEVWHTNSDFSDLDAAMGVSPSPAPAPETEPVAPRPFNAVKAFADSVLTMLDERIKAADRNTHPFNDYFGDQPETIVAAKAQAGELREVRTQVRMLGDRALVDLMKFKPANPSPAVGDGEREQFMAWQTRKGFSSDWGWDAWQARAAIAARHEKPVAWRYRTLAEKDWTLTQIDPGDSGEVVEPLYTERPSAVGDGQ
jgi:hypothetical protein